MILSNTMHFSYNLFAWICCYSTAALVEQGHVRGDLNGHMGSGAGVKLRKAESDTIRMYQISSKSY